MFSRVYSAAIRGMEVKTVEVEVNCTRLESEDGSGQGPNMILVGLPDAAIRESRERIWGALRNMHMPMPPYRATVNLAPADLRKSGTAYDLPIALAMLVSMNQLEPGMLADTLVIGELALNGHVRGIQGALAIALHARDQGFRRILVPDENAQEAALANGIEVFGVRSLVDVIQKLKVTSLGVPVRVDVSSMYSSCQDDPMCDFQDVKGQESAKRAMMVAAAGNHNILLIGTPGCGKSMIAKRLPSILPLLSVEEALEVTKIYSIAGVLDGKSGLMVRRPFRSPHHTVSDAGLVGGSANPRPGEISLAHNGVLFLDELPEFKRNALEVLRQPLENGEVTLARASGTYVFPAKVMLVAAMNPCPCGYYGHRTRACRCNFLQIKSYRSRISGPLVDRIDMHIEVAPISDDILTRKRTGENSASLRAKVFAAREVQAERYRGLPFRDNSCLEGRWLDKFCALDSDGIAMIRQVINDLKLSARAYDRILRVARTLADLDGKESIEQTHIWEAANYRILDRQEW